VRFWCLLVFLAGCHPPVPPPNHDHPVDPPCSTSTTRIDVPLFHGDRARLGWNADEPDLTPAALSSGSFGWLWDSPQLDAVTIGGKSYAPHLYASPLYVDQLVVSGGDWDGATVSAVIAATSNAWVYAVSACGRDVGGRHLAAGTMLWQTQLTMPDVVPILDGGVPLGVLSTPAIDLAATPPRLYAASMDAAAGWQVLALDLTSGQVLPGWPLTLTDAAVGAVNRNAPARFQPASVVSQRGALDLSLSGDRLYVPFGAYGDKGSGWMIAVDTTRAQIAAAFSSSHNTTLDTAYGGMWGSGGAAVGADDRVFDTTGNAPDGSGPQPGLWGDSFLAWQPTLDLVGTYSPWNYCQLDTADADLGGSSPMLIPDLDPAETATPHLITFGGKQGNVYLLDRDHLPGSLSSRPPCSMDPSSDPSLLAPDPQPQFGTRGPLNVFGPYTEKYGNVDYAKMRSTPAWFVDASGARFVFVAGSSKAAPDSMQSVPPSVARLRVNVQPGQPAFLSIDQHDTALAFVNPGSPVVTSHGADDAIVWVLDQNAQRVASLLDPATPHPILYAVDAASLDLLWRSPDDDLFLGGKYNTPAVAHGFVFVGTDRVQAYGLR
jgi:hypothetical protein